MFCSGRRSTWLNMAAILQIIGLLVALVIVVQAAENFEYTAEVVDSLQDFARLQNEQNPKSLKYELASDSNKILLKRNTAESGINFYVTNEGEEQVKPVIKATLSKSTEELNFYFREMEFHVSKNKAGNPYMELVVTFHEPEKKVSIEVGMQLYKPPSEKVNELHYEEHNVPVVPSPIPNLTEKEPENQEFLYDIAWMDEVLKRALYLETRPRDFFSKYTEVYISGPVIIDLDDYNAILRLERSFWRYSPDLLTDPDLMPDLISFD